MDDKNNEGRCPRPRDRGLDQNPFITFRRKTDESIASTLSNVFGLPPRHESRPHASFRPYDQECRRQVADSTQDPHDDEESRDLYMESTQGMRQAMEVSQEAREREEVERGERCPYDPRNTTSPSRLMAAADDEEDSNGPSADEEIEMGIRAYRFLRHSRYSPLHLENTPGLAEYGGHWREAFQELILFDRDPEMVYSQIPPSYPIQYRAEWVGSTVTIMQENAARRWAKRQARGKEESFETQQDIDAPNVRDLVESAVKIQGDVKSLFADARKMWSEAVAKQAEAATSEYATHARRSEEMDEEARLCPALHQDWTRPSESEPRPLQPLLQGVSVEPSANPVVESRVLLTSNKKADGSVEVEHKVWKRFADSREEETSTTEQIGLDGRLVPNEDGTIRSEMRFETPTSGASRSSPFRKQEQEQEARSKILTEVKSRQAKKGWFWS